jgi:hypothetical protein
MSALATQSNVRYLGQQLLAKPYLGNRARHGYLRQRTDGLVSIRAKAAAFLLTPYPVVTYDEFVHSPQTLQADAPSPSCQRPRPLGTAVEQVGLVDQAR